MSTMNILLELNFKQKNATRLLTCLASILSFVIFRYNTLICLGLGLLTALSLRDPKFVYAFAMTIGRDVLVIQRFLRLHVYMTYIEWRKWSLARIFQETVKKKPHAPCFKMDDRVMSFEQVEEFSNKVGAVFRSEGLQHGDCVALLMETRLEYAGIWLGLSKIGVVTALINSNLRRETLLHSIKVAKPKALIIGLELKTALEELITDDTVAALPIYQYRDENLEEQADLLQLKGVVDLNARLRQQQVVDLSAHIKMCQPSDKLLYVYTSGTTGLPKAAVITNLRYFFMAAAIHHITALRSDDVIYNPLPLYHTAGGIVAIGNSLVHGCCTILRKKFSASNFWKDCIRNECTVAQYIGELCRYLLSTPSKPEDTQHNLRMMYGNGLRPQIWTQFVSRFNIPHIAEIYGSTEGNSNLVNVSDQVGAVGFGPIYGRKLFPMQLIKCDEETGEILRNREGYCIRCQPGETGLMIGLVNPKKAVTAFHGYANKEESEKKILRNVFRKGDVYFNSGDMMVCDILGFFYFKDRTGDTFRWRGENVSTLEVEAIITNVIGLKDCAVYGVEIPHVEGKAGMAAIVDSQRNIDLMKLSIGIRGSLPAYAKPLFIRLMDQIPQTETFKMKKRQLMQEGFDIHSLKDPIYYLNKNGVYQPLTEEYFEKLVNGTAGL